MALSTFADDMLAWNANANSYFCRQPGRGGRAATSFPSKQSFESDPKHDRWPVILNAPGASTRIARNLAAKRSLMMPLSTGCSSLTAPTNTLPRMPESGDHGRLAYDLPSSSTSSTDRTLRPQLQPNIYSTSIYPVPRGPTASLANDSATSSPSTTASTLNSAVTEGSPVSTPHSPNSLHQSPFRIYKSSNGVAVEEDTTAQMDAFGQKDDASPVRPSTSASDSAALRRGRNMKNLSINTNGISASKNIDTRSTAKDGLAVRPVTQSGPAPTFKPGSLAAVNESTPASPSFIIPKVAPRRKPSKLGLTISTPESEQKGMVPPTPSFAATFASRHGNAPAPLQTIPQTPAFPPPLNFGKAAEPFGERLMSPSVGPPGGMQFPSVTGKELRTPGLAPFGGMTLPPFAQRSVDNSPPKRSSPGIGHRELQAPLGLYRPKSAEGINGFSSIVNQTIDHVNSIPMYDRPLSQEVKSPSYPGGPACIYPPNVYLYHQPTADEARKFDVIINVAREVTNPFELEAEAEKAKRRSSNIEPVRPAKPSYRSVGVQVELLTEDYPPRVSSPEEPPATAASDISFRSALERLDISPEEDALPTPRATKPQPEYIHLPWEHNSKVYEEWFEICKLIEDRTKKGKKVLIHCQLGVSRSASLIVAYGIYLNPHLRPDEAREQAKQRSRWIDLNMHFMYELGDFKKLLAKKGMAGAEVGSQANKHAKPGLLRSKTETMMLSPLPSEPPTPLSALGEMPGSAPFKTANGRDGQFAHVLEHGLSTPGPSSAPADVTWSPNKRPEGMEDDQNPPVLALPNRSMTPVPSKDTNKLPPPPLDVSLGRPSPTLQTPAFEMPGGWAATPALSRPTSMVLLDDRVEKSEAKTEMDALTERTPTRLSLAPSPEPQPELEATKPSRTPSFRRLPKMPSLPSGFGSLGSLFSLHRSSSAASKKSASPEPPHQSQSPSPPSVPADTRLSSSAPSAHSPTKKQPSLPALRTVFPPSNTSPRPSLKLGPVPVAGFAASHDEDHAALMSPRAQEFVANPFHRPMTSHYVPSGMTSTTTSFPQAPAAAAPPVAGFAPLGVRKQRSGQSLKSLNTNVTNFSVPHRTSSGASGGRTGGIASVLDAGSVGRRMSGQGSVLEDDDVRELMSPGAQQRDPRSPPSSGAWGNEERVMRNIDEVL